MMRGNRKSAEGTYTMLQNAGSLRILVVGCGNMGASHARAFQNIRGVEIAGLVSRGESKRHLARKLSIDAPLFDDLGTALASVAPDAVCISTYPDTHEAFTLAALEAGCHVFVEKPLAPDTEGARRMVEGAQRAGRKLVVGYILRHHPTWQKFIGIARTLGSPLVMRMNLNQQSSGAEWQVHRGLLASASPIVDCGVHYVDVMCQMVAAKPLRVSAIGACLDPSLPGRQYNYGQLQIVFSDGSVGWYEAGWGPMMSETAFFVKDVIGPRGAASIQSVHSDSDGGSAKVEDHVRSNAIRVHHSDLTPSGSFARPDEWLTQTDEPDHDELCRREQEFFVRAIREQIDLTSHLEDSLASLAIVLAADQAMRTGQPVDLSEGEFTLRASGA
jgi:predicted dehydrogenase